MDLTVSNQSAESELESNGGDGGGSGQILKISDEKPRANSPEQLRDKSLPDHEPTMIATNILLESPPVDTKEASVNEDHFKLRSCLSSPSQTTRFLERARESEVKRKLFIDSKRVELHTEEMSHVRESPSLSP